MTISTAPAPTTLSSYNTLHKAAFDKFNTLPDHLKLEAVASLLGISIEQLPVVKSHYTPEDDLSAIQKNMVFEVMKGGYKNATRGTFSVTSLFIQGESPDIIFKIDASKTHPIVIHLTKFKLSEQNHEICWCKPILSSAVPTEEDRWLIGQSPIFKSQALTETLIKIRSFLKDPSGIVIQFAGYCPKGWFENYSDIYPLLPRLPQRSREENKFNYLYSLKLEVEQVIRDIFGARKKAAWVQHHLAWYDKASGILHEILLTNNHSNGEILRPSEKLQLQTVIRVGDQGFREPGSFPTKAEMNARYTRVAGLFKPFMSPTDDFNTLARDIQERIGVAFQLQTEEPTDAAIEKEANLISKTINSYLTLV